jgi:hypothetical protein
MSTADSYKSRDGVLTHRHSVDVHCMTARSALARAAGTVVTVAAVAASAAPAFAGTAAQTPTPVPPLAACTTGALSQPFLAFKDKSFYTLAPGGDFATGAGWELTGGATIASATQPDGATGGVLDLPSRAQATSPPVCITAEYPTARAWARNLVGSEGVSFFVSYLRNGVWTAPKSTGQFHGDKSGAWLLSNSLNIQPSSTPGWQQARFTLVAGGTKSRFQVDELWVDPKLRG